MKQNDLPLYVETLLTEWGRWAKDSKPRGHCMSIEHRYKPELGEVWEQEDHSPAPNVMIVLRVERQIVALPRKLKGTLVIEFCQRPFSRTCRQYGIYQPDYRVLLDKAKNIMRNRLRHYEMFDIVG